jgi:hypothetical protein
VGTARKIKAPSRVDCTAKQADYAYWNVRAAANLANRHDVKPGIIPSGYGDGSTHEGLSPQKAADQAAVYRLQHTVAC